MVMSPSHAQHPSFTQHLHWKVGKFYADANGFIEYLIFAVGWGDLGAWRLEIHDKINFWSLTFEASLAGRKWYWCDISVDGGAYRLHLSLVLRCRSARLEVMDSIVTIDTGSEDTKIPGPAGPGRLWWERATNSLPYVDCHYEWWSWD